MTETLSPAQKAAQTRRLNKLARQQIAAVKAGSREPSPVGDSLIVRINLGDEDSGKIGCGIRDLLVLHVGTKWVELMYVPLLQKTRMPRVTFDSKAKPVPYDPKVIADRIRERIATFERSMPDDSELRVNAGRAALRMVEG
jgi:hypothetical protein